MVEEEVLGFVVALLADANPVVGHHELLLLVFPAALAFVEEMAAAVKLPRWFQICSFSLFGAWPQHVEVIRLEDGYRWRGWYSAGRGT